MFNSVTKRSALAFLLALKDSWWTVLLITALAVFIVYQRWTFSHLRHVPTKGDLVVTIGERVPSVTVRSLKGDSSILEWKNGPTIVYVFSPTCVWCQKNLQPSLELMRRAQGKYRVIGISLTDEGLVPFLKGSNIHIPVYIAGKQAKALKLNATPETLVISPDGIVTNVWLGAYSAEMSQDIRARLGVDVPAAQFQ